VIGASNKSWVICAIHLVGLSLRDLMGQGMKL